MKTFAAKKLNLVLAVTGACLGLMTTSSHANLSFQSASTTVGNNPVNATASIGIVGSTVTVTLTDLYQNPNSVASILNGIQISITGATGASGLKANDAATAAIGSGGIYSPGTTAGSTIASSIGWLLTGTSTIQLSALGSGQPQFTIIGPDANGNFTDGVGNAGYTAADGSIAANGPHNPFILGTETFNFTLNGGVLPESAITGVTFLFGTGTDYASGTPTPSVTSVPEPSTIVAGALLLLPFGISTLRIFSRRNQAQA